MYAKLLIISFFILSACSQQYFDQPQPIDGKNIYAFPAPFQGIWTDGKDSLIVAKYFFANIEYSSLSLPYTKRDTTAYALFRGSKVYPYDSIRQQILGVGTSFEVRNDSIYYEIRESLEVQLGRKAFLRQVGDQFVLNVKGDNDWWELFLMGVTDQRKLVVTYPSIDAMIEQDINPVLSNTEEDYFEVRWTTKQFNQLIKNNVFSDTLLFIEQQN
ncbi:MAG: hypothetical protein ABJO02_12905 [Reichenbachiella sp.]|uniref:hypothetical protein n=1 Tax=Reichenbachiella sp. TaxID=2184521 RepID=UPI003296D515